MKKNILLILVSITIALCLGEVTIRLISHSIPLNLDNRGSWIVISKKGYTLNKNSGLSLHQMGNNAVNYHFYPPHLRDTPIDKNAKHILVLGDSFTFGWLLPWNDTYINHLQKDSDKTFGQGKYQFLNASTAAWGTANYLAFLEEHGVEVSPSFVLVFLNTDDIGRSIKRNFYRLVDSNSLQLVENFHPSSSLIMIKNILASSLSNWLLQHSALAQFIRNYSSQFFVVDKGTMLSDQFESKKFKSIKPNIILPSSPDLSFQDEFAVHYGNAFFLRINKWCKQHHAKLMVVTTGFNAFYPDDMRDPTKTFLSEAESFFKKEGVPYYDIALPFKKAVQGKVFQIPGDHHPNAYGAQVIGQISWPWIKQQISQDDRHGQRIRT